MTVREMADALDEMTKDVTSDEAELLDGVLKTLKAKRRVHARDAAALEKVYRKYFPEEPEEGVKLLPEEEAEETDGE